MGAVAVLLVIVIASLVCMRAGAIALELSGMEREKARFQALSAGQKVLQARNESILAHGFSPLGKTKVERIFSLVETILIVFAGDTKNALKGAVFPRLRKR